ncbi:MAG TPA: aspartyl/asparaginyl beta-hydroxylase domain-containing protein [Steroidobacteraceae bacterium]|nr:aspartyl/asparaginyl beta-hydroxylase domain-containing protein [Steroidobacteraceae bacterium]
MNTTANPTVEPFVRAARDLAKAGRANEAEQHWRKVLELAPGHVEAVLALGTAAIARREPARAVEILRTAARPDPMVDLYQALAFKQLGNLGAERDAITRALDIDPYFFPALLHKGMLLERIGQRRGAARVFRDVLKVMPPQDRLSDAFRTAVKHAEASVAENQQMLEKHLDSVLDGLRREHGGPVDRFERSVDVLLGKRRMFHPEPVMFHFADLPPIQFYPRDLFPWLAELEAQSDAIREELLHVLAESRPEFRPYIQYPPGSPVNQWVELNHSPRWSTYFLWQNGQKVEAHCERCPRTTAALESVPMARLPNFSPTAMFSCLEPRTVIPPHTGETNTRLICHLPLVIPPKCSFRVGHVTREWTSGEAFVFDDSIEHEARNDSDELRAVLIFDVWNPNLTAGERDLVAALVNGVRDYYGSEP